MTCARPLLVVSQPDVSGDARVDLAYGLSGVWAWVAHSLGVNVFSASALLQDETPAAISKAAGVWLEHDPPRPSVGTARPHVTVGVFVDLAVGRRGIRVWLRNGHGEYGFLGRYSMRPSDVIRCLEQVLAETCQALHVPPVELGWADMLAPATSHGEAVEFLRLRGAQTRQRHTEALQIAQESVLDRDGDRKGDHKSAPAVGPSMAVRMADTGAAP